ncbi:hypothetical protein QMZ92_11280 [Streptomyces sp. HNM0645]|uniref:hypothetical protein n=1 Tax=Streptomyces sp. HNM0645 TaxID=2782343 RepID=UPI0024B7AD89|nr:hypothetical protein [Streptomyces sp. HNM0645]MDI9884957.1 hypothetical protein [Streptomyces sp. HNM0645]
MSVEADQAPLVQIQQDLLVHPADTSLRRLVLNLDGTAESPTGNDGRLGDALVGEDFGEATAEYHAVPENYPKAVRVDDRKTGNRRFDQVWRIEDGKYLIVEAKAPNGKPTPRDSVDGRLRVMQGTREYILAVFSDMRKRAVKDPAERAHHGTQVRKA